MEIPLRSTQTPITIQVLKTKFKDIFGEDTLDFESLKVLLNDCHDLTLLQLTNMYDLNDVTMSEICKSPP